MVHFNKLWYEVNETVSFSCKHDGHLGTLSKSTCSADGTWTPPPTCVSTTSCPIFPVSCPIYSLE